MKNFLVIGMGRFGQHLSQKLAELGNDVMIVDKSEEAVNRLIDVVTCAQVADCKNEDVLKSLSVNSFDMCIVCIGNDFQSSLEITSLLKDLGAKMVVSKASTKIQEKFLLRNGADVVVDPEKDLAHKLAVQYSARNVFDYYRLSNDIAIYETSVPRTWMNKSLKEIDVRKIHGINVLATKKNGQVKLADVDYKFGMDDHVLIMGNVNNIEKFTRNI